MKLEKVQQEILKDFIKFKKVDHRYFETDERVFIVSPNGAWMMGIPKELFLLDESKIFKERNACNGKTLIEKRLNTQTVIDTATTVTHRNEKLHLFTIGDETIYINEKYLNYFDQNNSTFTGTNKNSPIYMSGKTNS